VSWKTPNEAPQEARKAPAPRRREKRLDHLNPHIVPVERALLARAEALEAGNVSVSAGCVAIDGGPSPLGVALAGEFRTLAEELHWWA
jgi:hypothetical protein